MNIQVLWYIFCSLKQSSCCCHLYPPYLKRTLIYLLSTQYVLSVSHVLVHFCLPAMCEIGNSGPILRRNERQPWVYVARMRCRQCSNSSLNNLKAQALPVHQSSFKRRVLQHSSTAVSKGLSKVLCTPGDTLWRPCFPQISNSMKAPPCSPGQWRVTVVLRGPDGTGYLAPGVQGHFLLSSPLRPTIIGGGGGGGGNSGGQLAGMLPAEHVYQLVWKQLNILTTNGTVLFCSNNDGWLCKTWDRIEVETAQSADGHTCGQHHQTQLEKEVWVQPSLCPRSFSLAPKKVWTCSVQFGICQNLLCARDLKLQAQTSYSLASGWTLHAGSLRQGAPWTFRPFPGHQHL